MQNIGQDTFVGIGFPLPPLDEQQTIVRFLDAKIGQIDALVAQKRQLIAKLKEKRSALISRTVTRGLPPEAAKAAGIPFSVVPGITAAAGATAYAGIPLTHRDHAQSAVLITGHCQKDGQEADWPALAASNQTLVIYMGLISSPVIQEKLLAHGRSPNTPIALIERGTTASQRVIRGELENLARLAQGAQSPSLIVVGEVAALADELGWFAGDVVTNPEHLVSLA